MNGRSKKSYNGIVITRLRPLYYIFIAQLKFNICIYRIRENIYNIVKLSPDMFYSVIQVCRMILANNVKYSIEIDYV